ncbi:MAG: response regulator transcription factor [Chitinophagales bacterium]|nr:response regulator transcription factor [Bacteroidota bacterium]MBX7140719.1 response regulator transcription factor [Chitinophagales bacterium]
MRCIIVDDEPLAQEVLETYVQRVDDLQLLKKCSNAMEAMQTLHKEHVDLMFLDIQMPVIDGLSFLKSLKNPPAVIITTAYPNHALEGFDLDVADYLLKPISFERFLKAVNKVADHRRNAHSEVPDPDYTFLKVDSKLVKVNYADIVFVEGMKDYLKIFVKGSDKPLVVHQTMKRFEDMLPKGKFIRVHKSYIISLGMVNSIVGNFVQINGREIPIGANYKDQLIGMVSKING